MIAALVRRSFHFWTGSILLLAVTNVQGQTITFDDSDPEVIVLSNGVHYEIEVSKINGSILRLTDLATGESLLEGTIDDLLWQVEIPHEGSVDVVNPFSSTFEYSWSDVDHRLTMACRGERSATEYADIEVAITLYAEPLLDLQMSLSNEWGDTATVIRFPASLGVNLGPSSRVVLAASGTGVMMGPDFFAQGEDFLYDYPDVFHADYVGLLQGDARAALYTIRNGLPPRMTRLGLQSKGDSQGGSYAYFLPHTYHEWVESGSAWTSPVSRIRMGLSHLEGLEAYRVENGIDQYPSIQEKMGSGFSSIAKSPMYVIAFGQNVRLDTYPEYAPWESTHPGPGIVMLSMYYTGGYHGHHPNYYPAEPQFGSTAEFIQVIRDIQAQGKLVMPLTLPIWWHEESQAVADVGGAAGVGSVAVMRQDGSPFYSSYYSGWIPEDPYDWGYFVSPYSPFVRQKMDDMYRDIFDTYGADLIYEDVLGTSNTTYDFNTTAPTPVDYTTGWLEHAWRFRDYPSIVEGGYDKMAENLTGFVSTSYSGVVTFQRDWDHAGDTGFVRAYPTSAVLYQDKIIPFGYWSNDPTDIDWFSWRLLFGKPLSMSIDDGVPGREGGSAAHRVVQEFQTRVVYRLAGKRMTGFEDLDGAASRSTYGDITVTKNWDKAVPLIIDPHTISPAGALLTSESGDLVAGTFTRYDGASLTPGDHYLIVENGTDVITVSQPKGDDTPLSIRIPASWPDESEISVVAVLGDREEVATHEIAGGVLQFDWNRSVGADDASRYEIRYTGTVIGVGGHEDLPGAVQLHEAFPNPFSTRTTIRYDLARPGPVTLSVFDVLGREVATLVEAEKPAGSHRVDFVPSALTAGVYFYVLNAGRRIQARKLVLVR